jgi:hypothetical protein
LHFLNLLDIVKIRAIQHVDVTMFSNGKFKNTIAVSEEMDGLPLTGGNTLDRKYCLTLMENGGGRHWVALEDRYGRYVTIFFFFRHIFQLQTRPSCGPLFVAGNVQARSYYVSQTSSQRNPLDCVVLSNQIGFLLSTITLSLTLCISRL